MLVQEFCKQRRIHHSDSSVASLSCHLFFQELISSESWLWFGQGTSIGELHVTYIYIIKSPTCWIYKKYTIYRLRRNSGTLSIWSSMEQSYNFVTTKIKSSRRLIFQSFFSQNKVKAPTEMRSRTVAKLHNNYCGSTPCGRSTHVVIIGVDLCLSHIGRIPLPRWTVWIGHSWI